MFWDILAIKIIAYIKYKFVVERFQSDFFKIDKLFPFQDKKLWSNTIKVDFQIANIYIDVHHYYND